MRRHGREHWHTGTWLHRAYWGENLIPFGRDNSTERRKFGALPPAGKWVRLEGSYRFPPGLVPHLRRFAEQHVPGTDIDLPTAVQGELFEPVQLRWLQVPAREAVEACLQAAADLTQAAAPAVSWADITLLVGSHKFTRNADKDFPFREEDDGMVSFSDFDELGLARKGRVNAGPVALDFARVSQTGKFPTAR